MKRHIWVLAILLLATPGFAQDEGGGGGLPSSLFGGGDFGGGGNRGQQANPMDAVKKFFSQANVAISGDQEKAMKPIVEGAFKQVQDTVEKFNAEQTPGGAAGGERGFRGQGGGQGGDRRGGGGGFDGQRRGRGGDRGGGSTNNPALNAELQKINDDVLPKLVATLKPDQQTAFKKWQNTEIKKQGGYAALKVTMDEAGAPISDAQEPQIRNLYLEDSQ